MSKLLLAISLQQRSLGPDNENMRQTSAKTLDGHVATVLVLLPSLMVFGQFLLNWLKEASQLNNF